MSRTARSGLTSGGKSATYSQAKSPPPLPNHSPLTYPQTFTGAPSTEIGPSSRLPSPALPSASPSVALGSSPHAGPLASPFGPRGIDATPPTNSAMNPIQAITQPRVLHLIGQR